MGCKTDLTSMSLTKTEKQIDEIGKINRAQVNEKIPTKKIGIAQFKSTVNLIPYNF